MQSARDVDAFLLLTLATAAKRRPATLVEIMAAADLSHGAIPYRDELGDAFHQLATHGLIREVDGCYTLTQEGEVIIAKQPKKAGTSALIASIRDSLLAHRGKDKHPPILISEVQIADAIMARDDVRPAAQQLIYLWFLSAFYLVPAKSKPGDPRQWLYGSNRQYEHALIWKVIDAHAPMMPGGKGQYWIHAARPMKQLSKKAG